MQEEPTSHKSSLKPSLIEVINNLQQKSQAATSSPGQEAAIQTQIDAILRLNAYEQQHKFPAKSSSLSLTNMNTKTEFSRRSKQEAARKQGLATALSSIDPKTNSTENSALS